MYRRKTKGFYIRNLKRTWIEFCWQLVAWLPLKTQLISVSYLSETLVSRRYWNLLLPPGSGLLQAASLRKLIIDDLFQGSLPKAEMSGRCWSQHWPPASHRGLSLLCCQTDSPLHEVVTVPLAKARELTQGLEAVMLAWEVLSLHRDTVSREHPQEVRPALCTTEIPRAGRRRKAVPREEFQGGWTAPAPEFTAPQPEVVAGPWRHAGPLCAQGAPSDWSLACSLLWLWR